MNEGETEVLSFELKNYIPSVYYITLRDDLDGTTSRFTIDRQVAKHINNMRQEIIDLRKERDELLYAVAKKFPGESRFDTALRYIRQAEESVSATQPKEAREK